MKPGHLDLPTIWRGCDYPAFTLTWLNFDGTAIDLTGWTPRAQSKQVNFNPTVQSPAWQGVTQVFLSNFDTADLPLGVEEWDWVFIHTSGVVTPPLLSGTVTIKEPITPTPISNLPSS